MSRKEKLVAYIRQDIDDEYDPDQDELIALMDSVSLLQLIMFIDQDLGIQLDMSSLSQENFANMDALLQLLEECKSE